MSKRAPFTPLQRFGKNPPQVGLGNLALALKLPRAFNRPANPKSLQTQIASRNWAAISFEGSLQRLYTNLRRPPDPLGPTTHGGGADADPVRRTPARILNKAGHN